jgi:hypothetical protein
MKLDKYSIGIGDRFSHQGEAQLQALINAKSDNIKLTPVWNKSHREHSLTGTKPNSVREEADEAVKALEWRNSYYVDADHIGLDNVDLFIDASDYFTLDVADFIGKNAPVGDVREFLEKYKKFVGKITLPGIDCNFEVTEDKIKSTAKEYLLATKEAGKIYRYIDTKKGVDEFIIELSMDETNSPQTPLEIFFILAAIADENIPVVAFAPKFSGHFNKGVDYKGDILAFERELEQNISVIALAIKEFTLPQNLKLSVHSGSDKYSIYGCINKLIKKHAVGLHLKTAGTTWLEEIIGLALAGGEGLRIVKDIYSIAHDSIDELSAPYRTVIDINRNLLPSTEVVNKWSSEEFALALRHNTSCEKYNPNLRQLFHISYKIAADMGMRFTQALEKFDEIVSERVTENIYHHIKQVFG